jgi:tartrate-resistant acid phosphatase type 5
MTILVLFLFSCLYGLNPNSNRTAKLIAFGDWGDSHAVRSIDRINQYIQSEEPHAVFLLGDNFYPRGVTRKNLHLFSDHLAANVSNSVFVPVLGNHDYLGDIQPLLNYSHPQWYMPSRSHLLKFRHMVNESTPTGLFSCAWFIDSIEFDHTEYLKLQASLEKSSSSCLWRIIVSHYPIVTAGVYRSDAEVVQFRRRIGPLLNRYKIDFFIAGHDHTSQILTSPGFPETVFLIAGASTAVNHRSIVSTPASFLPGATKLVWYNDSDYRVVLLMEFSLTKFQYKFVKLSGKREEVIREGTKVRK